MLTKSATRRYLRRFKRWLRQDTSTGPRPGPDGFLYAWINEQLTEMAEDGLRKPYAWGMLQGAVLGVGLGFDRVSMVEFGVAGGNGLVQMESIACRISKVLPNVKIDIYGFDTGVGLPPPTDHRDVPNLCSSGLYPMDEQKLRARLCRSQLVLGNLQETIGEFLTRKPAPLAFIACDLVLYTSTVHGLRILDANEDVLLPRVHCYFDDVLGFTFGDYNGERLAIHEFNAAHPTRKVSPLYGLKHYVPSAFSNEAWVDKFWMSHIFDHSMYGRRDLLVQGHNLDLTEN
jgi:hypothetical protein